MKYQRVVSLTLGLSFIVMFISSGVLYFIPDRGVTGWSSWSFLGLDKQQWDNLHINFGLLFLGFLVWHIYYNWKPIKNYLKNKKEMVIFTKEFNFSLILTSLFLVGTINMVLPFSFFVNLGNGIKAKNANHQTPPFAYAEMATFRDFCLILDIDETKAREIMKEHNLTISSKDETLKDIAKNSGISSKEIYNLIKMEHKAKLPTSIPVGLAHKTLKQLSHDYHIDTDRVINYLKTYNINIHKNIPFKKIAKTNNIHPAKLYNMILASQVEK